MGRTVFPQSEVPDYVVRWEDGMVAKTDSVIEKREQYSARLPAWSCSLARSRHKRRKSTTNGPFCCSL